jgi:hypothetical protein
MQDTSKFTWISEFIWIIDLTFIWENQIYNGYLTNYHSVILKIVLVFILIMVFIQVQQPLYLV